MGAFAAASTIKQSALLPVAAANVSSAGAGMVGRARSPGASAKSKAGLGRGALAAGEGALQLSGGLATPVNGAAGSGGGRPPPAGAGLSARGTGGSAGKSAKKPGSGVGVSAGAHGGAAEKGGNANRSRGHVISETVCDAEVEGAQDDNSWENGWITDSQVSAGDGTICLLAQPPGRWLACMSHAREGRQATPRCATQRT